MSPIKPATTPPPTQFEMSDKVKSNGLTIYSNYTVNRTIVPRINEKDIAKYI